MEVEAKIALSSCDELEGIRRRLAELGAVLEEAETERDTYYQHPCRDFAETDEALRLRRTKSRVEVTYKGPKRIIGGAKERLELTVSVDDGEAADAILRSLGFKPVLDVVKEREYYRLGDVEVSLDRVEGLGCFVEIEYRGSGSREEAARSIEEAAAALGLSEKPRIYKSYLELILERRGAAP